MTASDSVPLHALAEDNLAAASPDLLRAMVKTFADALMSAEADAVCGAEYGQVSEDRVNSRNGYRNREWDTRAGTVELAIPKLRSGSYFPHWLLERRRRAEQALVQFAVLGYAIPSMETETYRPARLILLGEDADPALHRGPPQSTVDPCAAAGDENARKERL